MAIGQCSVDECEGEWRLTLGMCSAHYQRRRRYGDPKMRVRHKQGATCSVDGCQTKPKTRQLCSAHYRRLQLTGDTADHKPVRRNLTGRHVMKGSGYARIKIDYEHPRAYSSGWILEHVVVMERKLGRRLLPGENVHHINGVRDDNRPENLELWVTMQPTGQRPEDLVAWAKEVLRRYE